MHLRVGNRNQKPASGFTIIEVMIVLAIAGLIMVIVFLAVPALQRSSRNTQRKTDANNTMSALSTYVTSNSGLLPAAACTGATPCAFLSNVTLGFFATGSANVSYVPTFPGSITTPTSDQMQIIGGGKCASLAGVPTSVGASSRNIAIYFGIEGTPATQCISE